MYLTRCSAVGSALGSGPRGRWFESSHFDQSASDAVLVAIKRDALGIPSLIAPFGRARLGLRDRTVRNTPYVPYSVAFVATLLG